MEILCYLGWQVKCKVLYLGFGIKFIYLAINPKPITKYTFYYLFVNFIFFGNKFRTPDLIFINQAIKNIAT